MIFSSLTDFIYQLQEHASWLKTCPYRITQQASWTFEGPRDQPGDRSPRSRHRRWDPRNHVVLLALSPSEAWRVQTSPGIGVGAAGHGYQPNVLRGPKPAPYVRQDNAQTRSNVIYCFSCGETNHSTHNCKHNEPLSCHRCKRIGHKEKIVTTTTDVLATEDWNQFMFKTMH